MIPTLQLIQQTKGIHEVDRILAGCELKKTKTSMEYLVVKEEIPSNPKLELGANI
jgi:hypothetical protein